MADQFRCESCSGSSGCTSRHTAEQTQEEISAAPYLLIAGLVIVGLSILLQWVF